MTDRLSNAEMNTRFQTFQVGNLSLAGYTSGEGSPVVVLETGLLAESDAWAPVAHGISPFTKVFWYDRAGRGKSSPGPDPRTIERIAHELHALLGSAGLPGPYILVGQSVGGLIMRQFAWLYPRQTAGLVLVDPTHEDQFETIASLLPEPEPGDSPALRRLREFWTKGYRDPYANAERINFEMSCAQARAVGSFGEIPLILLAAGAGFSDLGLPVDTAARLQAAMLDLHRRTVALSSTGRLEVLPNSSHFIQRDDPQHIIRAVHELFRQFKTQGGRS